MTNEEFNKLAEIARKHFDKQSEELENLRGSLLKLLSAAAGESETKEEEKKPETDTKREDPLTRLNNIAQDKPPEAAGADYAEDVIQYMNEAPEWKVFNEDAIDFLHEPIENWRDITISYRKDIRKSDKGFAGNVRIEVEDPSDPSVIEAVLTYALAVIVNRLNADDNEDNGLDESQLAVRIATMVTKIICSALDKSLKTLVDEVFGDDEE